MSLDDFFDQCEPQAGPANDTYCLILNAEKLGKQFGQGIDRNAYSLVGDPDFYHHILTLCPDRNDA
jgi:hypothetical protein